MSQGTQETAEAKLNSLELKRRSWLVSMTRWLHPYRPRVRDWRFWTVQGLIVIIAGTHSAAEVLKLTGHPLFLGAEPRVALASFVTVSLLFIPVVYAGLNFGLVGSVATAAWCTFLVIPNLVVFHEGFERLRELLQIGIVDAIAVFVGERVDRETRARERAEALGGALQASERKYRGLFQSSPVPILLLDRNDVVLEANPAAGLLFERPIEELRSIPVAQLVGTTNLDVALDTALGKKGQESYIVLKRRDGIEVFVEPALTRIGEGEERLVTQVLLRDATEERHRQVGLRTYAAQIMRAQEEERKRIAQELHDETVQVLILLCRRLDSLEVDNPVLPPSAINELREARKTVEDVVEDIRAFARALRPPILEDLGLVTSIRRLLLELGERTQVKGHLKVLGKERRLPPETELGLFRIAQESIRNVERHAHATHVTVTVTFAEHQIGLDVLDDGVGFTLPTRVGDFAATGQLGLLGIYERAQLLGGSLEIKSSPGSGASVYISVPCALKAIPETPS